MKYYVGKNERGYRYINVGVREFFAPQYRVWVKPECVKKDENDREYVELPAVGCKLVKTEKGNYVVVPDERYKIFVVGRECGYRGDSYLEMLSPDDALVLEFTEYKSERGTLGVSRKALVSTTADEVVVKEEANGRLYGDSPRWVKKYWYDGEFHSEIDGTFGDDELDEIFGG